MVRSFGRLARTLAAGGVLFAMLLSPALARAQGNDPFASSHGEVRDPFASSHTATEDSPIIRARDLLRRAKLADDGATADEKLANEIDKKLTPLRDQAASARKQVEHASAQDRDAAIAVAEQAEAELMVSSIEVTQRRKTAADARKNARDLRERAVRIIKGEETPAVVVNPAPVPIGVRHCRPPYWCSDDIFRERL